MATKDSKYSLVELIKQSIFFQNVSDQDLQKIISIGKHFHYEENHTFIRENSLGTEVFVLLTGIVEVTVSYNNSKNMETIATLLPGDVFGELILLGKSKRSANVISKDKCEVVMWDKDILMKFFESETKLGFKFMTNLASVLADRLSATNQLLRNSLNNITRII